MAEQLHPPVKSAKIMNGEMMKTLKLPEGYERLTLDGKMAYLKQWTEMSVADPRLRYYDGRCAAVGPGNSPLGGQNVDRLWLNKNIQLTMQGTEVEPDSTVGEMFDMVQKYETARFVRQNFPIDRFEGGSIGSPFDQDPPVEPNQGKGKGRAKSLTVEELRDGLTFPERQAMDMQMDHDLQGISDDIIRDWWNEKYLDVGPSQVPPIEKMRMLYWSQNPGNGPGVGDYTEWGSQPAQSPPQDIEIREPPSRPNSPNSPNDPTNPPNSPNLPQNNPPNTPVGPNSPIEPYPPSFPNDPNTPDDPDSDSDSDKTIRPSDFQNPNVNPNAEEQARQAEEQARQAEEQARQAKEQAQQAEDPVRQAEEHIRQGEEQLRKWDEELRDEAQKIRKQNRRIRKEEARQKIREQIRDADEQLHKDEAARMEEARMQRHAEEITELRQELQRSDLRMKADEAEEALARQRIKDWQREYQEAQRQADKEASQRAKQGKNDGGKPNKGRGHNREKTDRGNGGT